MASFIVKKTSKSKFTMNSEFQNFPLTFVNGLRRICLSEIPTVVVTNIEVLKNTTQMPHEMLIHRMSLLPINVMHTETNIIRDAKIELRQLPDPDNNHELTTDDFVIHSGREHLLMKDRDLGTPLLFIRVRKGEEIHIKGDLAVELGSQVCTVSTKFHIDPERAEVDKKSFIEGGGDERVFDNFQIQRSYSVDERGRPNWIDMYIESVGVLESKHILKLAVEKLRSEVDSWVKNAKIARESEPNVYSVSLDQGGHTVGALLQEVIYHTAESAVVSYDIPHPLKNTMVIRFLTENKPEDVIKNAHKTIHDYCEIVENGL